MKIKYTPFDFQEKAIVKGLEVLTDSKGRDEVLVAATAAGKSIIIAEIANRLPKDGNILVIQPNKELLEQNVEKISTLGIVPAIYSASLKQKNIGRVTYATPQSITVEAFKEANIKYMLYDECDKFSQGSSRLKGIKKALKIKSCLGLTASPIYLKSSMGGSQLKIMTRVMDKFFKDICHVIQIQEMIEAKRWSKIVYQEHEFDKTGLIINTNGSEYTEKSIIENFTEANNDVKIQSILDTIPKDESVLIYVPSIALVEEMQTKIKGSVCVHSKTPPKERTEIINGFKSGKYKVLINALILVEGFDYPNLRHIIDAYPTRSARIYMQKLGRLVRIHKDKPFGTYHDIAGNIDSFGKVEDITFENIEGYGWGMFTGEYLLTGVPLAENLQVTKTKLRARLVKQRGSVFDFEFDFKEGEEIFFTFGKYHSKSIKEIYEKDRQYLAWIIKPETGFQWERISGGMKIKKELLKIFKV